MKTYCDRQFSAEEIAMIRQLINMPSLMTRRALSREICHRLNWRKLNGDLKDMGCRVALLRMQKDGLIELPPPGHCNASGPHVITHTSVTEGGRILS